MNEIEIAAILHVQYRGSAALHCIILYQNGHSGPKSSEIVSKNIYILMLFFYACHATNSFRSNEQICKHL